MERSFKKEVQALKLGDGETFHGEGILAVTKALLQSGVSYVGGYQGAPVSHLLDVLVDAEDIIGDLGVHLETCTNEASAAAMLGASINYPLRGAVTWKSIVGTNVAADALSNLASPGVVGGVMIILGEDYGEGASVIQERSYAYAMKSSMWLIDPRPDLPTIVRMVEEGFELSEASHAPVMMELRIRACHVTGEFKTKDNVRAAVLRQEPHRRPAALPVRQARASAGHFFPGAAQGRGAPARGASLHPRAQAQRGHSRRPRRRRHRRHGRAHQQRAARALPARARRPVRRLARAHPGPQCRLSAGSRGGAELLRRQARRARGRGGLAGLHRGQDQRRAAPRRHPDPRARQGLPAEHRRVHLGSVARGSGRASSTRRAPPISTARRSRPAAGRCSRTRPVRWRRSAISRHGPRTSAPAARNGRSSPPSS